MSTTSDNDDPDARQARARQAALADDREDLLTILRLRFGGVGDDVRERINACDDFAMLERLILVAANVPSEATFREELAGHGDEFKVAGERYNPVSPPTSPSAGGGAPGPTTPHPSSHVIQIRRRQEEDHA